jgi:hypothetical protein
VFGLRVLRPPVFPSGQGEIHTTLVVLALVRRCYITEGVRSATAYHSRAPCSPMGVAEKNGDSGDLPDWEARILVAEEPFQCLTFNLFFHEFPAATKKSCIGIPVCREHDRPIVRQDLGVART